MHVQSELDAIAQQFELSQDKLCAITSQFIADFALGLGAYNHPMAMIPTFVTDVPNGTEVGWVPTSVAYQRFHSNAVTLSLRTFLALDLGGTNLYVPLTFRPDPRA